MSDLLLSAVSWWAAWAAGSSPTQPAGSARLEVLFALAYAARHAFGST